MMRYVNNGARLDQTELFVDLNCPFCFCQIDRVVSLDLCEIIRWKGIEHEPELPVPSKCDHGSESHIAGEILQLSQRESDFKIFDPGFRPNTRLANQWLCAVARICPTRLWETVHAVAVALWREGKDISLLSTLLSIRFDRNLPHIRIQGIDERQAERHTQEWLSGPFERRLPAARSPYGATLLGLNSKQRFHIFIQSGKFSGLQGESC